MDEEKIIELQNRIKENPQDYDAVEQYAIALSDIGENQEALKNFMFLKSVQPNNAKVYYNIGIILEKLKMAEDSIVAYEKALSLEPENTDIMFNLSIASIKAEDYERAEELLLKVIQKDREDENAYFHLGESCTRLKKHEDAIKYFSKALELDKTDLIAKFYLAYEYKEIGETDTAIKLYNEIISENKEYSWVYYNLASIYLEKGEEDKAIIYLEKTIKTNDKDIDAIKMIVKLFAKGKKFAPAERILRQALQVLPDQADLYYLLAQIYQQMKSKINYAKYLKMALSKSITFTGDIEKLKEEVEALDKKPEIKKEGS
ncbi:tetratricopeptide repeat protein [bacterium]|nr:tetratricopeptide repeat protein [bacterium]